MVQFVQILVQGWVVKPTVKAIDHEIRIRKEHEDGGKEVWPSIVTDIVIHFTVSSVRKHRRRHHQYRHEWNRTGGNSDLMLNLLHQFGVVLWVDGFGEEFLLGLLEKEEVRQGSKEQVEKDASSRQNKPEDKHLMR